MDHFHATLPGWFDFADLYAAQVAKAPKTGAHFVECGTFLGKSAAFLAVEIANSGKAIQFETCDSFVGIERANVPDDAEWARYQATLAEVGGDHEAACRRHLEPVAGYVTVRAVDAIAAAATYADASLDFVFLDDDHSTAHVLNELAAWWPKIKPGGTLAGHDLDWPEVRRAVDGWAVRMGLPHLRVSERSWAIEKPVPQEGWTVPRKRRRCLVAVCCNERTIDRQTAESLIKLGWGQRILDATKTHEFQDVLFGWFHRYLLVSDLRDEAALTALKLHCSHILYLDADMTWPSDVVTRMLAHHHRGMVGGLYYLKKWPHWPVALRDGRYNAVDKKIDYTYDEHAPHSDVLRREELIGMGCTLVPTEVFRRLPRPWFEYGVDEQHLVTITEDVPFCQKVAALGCPIWIDPTVACGHRSTQTIDESWFNRGMIEREMVEQELNREAEARGARRVSEVRDGVVFPAV